MTTWVKGIIINSLQQSPKLYNLHRASPVPSFAAILLSNSRPPSVNSAAAVISLREIQPSEI
ncbi:unnamed protein product [Coffea canephora]|uniref:Uncharacterized protein n=1 Tax=Coffea canephora TaxID=49390 RepID=A0A068U2D5_COFCA|nr:unnamed protein product [Coffea canephora]